MLLRKYAWRFGKGSRRLQLQAVEDSLYAPQHPYRALADARAFFAEYYQPARVRLVLLGGFDAPRAKALLERHLGSLPAAANARLQLDRRSSCSRISAHR